MALLSSGLFGAIARKKPLPTIEVAPARQREGSPLALPNRARFRWASPRRYRREHSSRPQHSNGTSRQPKAAAPKAAAAPRIKLLSHGFCIDHPDPELGEQLMDE